MLATRDGKSGKFGNWTFSLGQHRPSTNVGNGFVANTPAWALTRFGSLLAAASSVSGWSSGVDIDFGNGIGICNHLVSCSLSCATSAANFQSWHFDQSATSDGYTADSLGR
jgi:hypothetical protein